MTSKVKYYNNNNAQYKSYIYYGINHANNNNWMTAACTNYSFSSKNSKENIENIKDNEK
jgi:hypothetical protein